MSADNFTAMMAFAPFKFDRGAYDEFVELQAKEGAAAVNGGRRRRRRGLRDRGPARRRRGGGGEAGGAPAEVEELPPRH